MEYTGSKWFPVIDACTEQDGITVLEYDTAWAPNYLTLVVLSKRSGWLIETFYREDGLGFDGEMIVRAGKVIEHEVREF